MRLVDVRHATVLGLGVSGVAACEVLLGQGVKVRAAHLMAPSESPSPQIVEAAASLSEKGTQVTLGEVPQDIFVDADLIVVSPGIAPSAQVMAQAASTGTPVISEVELGWMLGERRVIGITGTNGKTTTTSLVTHILVSAGKPAVAVGNIGLPYSKAVLENDEGTIFVCEVSSAQLHFTRTFRPVVAVVLNVADDHFDWHGSREEYVRAKANITQAQTDQDLLIVLSGDEGCTAIAAASKARLAAFGLEEPHSIRADAEMGVNRTFEAVAGLEGSDLVIEGADEEPARLPIADIRLQGRHNIENALAASVATMAMGVRIGAVAEALRSFEALPHRMTLVREKDGVTYIDDSKATNPHATLRALDGLDQVILIAGGLSKDLDLGVLRQAADRLNAVIAIGEATDEISAVFSGAVQVHRSASIEEAVKKAASIAEDGSTVLLSPACSSWDQFRSYAERGDRFRAAVEAL